MSRSQTGDPSVRIVGRRTGTLIAAALVVGNLSNYVLQIVAGRGLSVDDYGLLSGLMAIVTVIAVSTSALQTIAARALASGEVEPPTRRVDGLTRSAIVGAVAVGIAGVALSPWLGRALDVGPVPVIVLAAYVLPSAIDSIAAGRLQGTRRFVGLAGYSASQAMTKLALAATVVALGAGSTGILAAIVAATALVALVGLNASASAGAVDTHALGAEGRRTFAAIALVWTMLSVDVLIARARFAGGDAGLYAAAAVIGKAVLWFPLVVTQLVFPALASTETSPPMQRALLKRAAIVVLAIAGASVVALVLFGGTFYRMVYGARYQDAASVAWIVGIAVTPWTLVNLVVFQRLARERGEFLKWFTALAILEVLALLVVPPTGRWFAATLGACGVVALLTVSLTPGAALLGRTARASRS